VVRVIGAFLTVTNAWLHYNHPLFPVGPQLCFESGQQSLAAGGISDYHLSRNFISAPRAYSANSPLDYPLKQ
jgi:hypothetical protein